MIDDSSPATGAIELERVEDGEIVEDAPSWEQHVSEWAEGARQEFVGQLRQCRAAASVARHYGRGSMKAFAQEVGASKTKVYDFARVWWVYGHLFEDGDERFPTRGISHYIAALRADDPVAMLERSEDEDLSVRQMEAEMEDGEQREAAGSRNVELVEVVVCAHCGAEYPLSEAMTRKVER